MERVCVFDDCDEQAKYMLTARWPDGQFWRREVCAAHMSRGIESLHKFRGLGAGEPSITLVALDRVSQERITVA